MIQASENLEEKEEFLSKTFDEQDEEHKTRLRKKYGKDWSAPDCDECDGWQL